MVQASNTWPLFKLFQPPLPCTPFPSTSLPLIWGSHLSCMWSNSWGTTWVPFPPLPPCPLLVPYLLGHLRWFSVTAHSKLKLACPFRLSYSHFPRRLFLAPGSFSLNVPSQPLPSRLSAPLTLGCSTSVSRTDCQSADKQWLDLLHLLFIKSLNLQEDGSPGLGSLTSVEVYIFVHLATFPHQSTWLN